MSNNVRWIDPDRTVLGDATISASSETDGLPAQNVQNLINYPWILIPGIFIFLTIMSYNFLGDYLRDILSPRDGGER